MHTVYVYKIYRVNIYVNIGHDYFKSTKGLFIIVLNDIIYSLMFKNWIKLDGGVKKKKKLTISIVFFVSRHAEIINCNYQFLSKILFSPYPYR